MRSSTTSKQRSFGCVAATSTKGVERDPGLITTSRTPARKARSHSLESRVPTTMRGGITFGRRCLKIIRRCPAATAGSTPSFSKTMGASSARSGLLVFKDLHNLFHTADTLSFAASKVALFTVDGHHQGAVVVPPPAHRALLVLVLGLLALLTPSVPGDTLARFSPRGWRCRAGRC